jgi:hypothetical protein
MNRCHLKKKEFAVSLLFGAATLVKMTHNIMTLGLMTLGIVILTVTKVSNDA